MCVFYIHHGLLCSIAHYKLPKQVSISNNIHLLQHRYIEWETPRHACIICIISVTWYKYKIFGLWKHTQSCCHCGPFADLNSCPFIIYDSFWVQLCAVMASLSCMSAPYPNYMNVLVYSFQCARPSHLLLPTHRSIVVYAVSVVLVYVAVHIWVWYEYLHIHVLSVYHEH
jgi:hypothetical protein